MAAGYQPADSQALLGALRRLLAASVPDDARLGGPGPGYRWRVLDSRGRDTAPPIRGRDSIGDCVEHGVRVRQPTPTEYRSAALGLIPTTLTVEADR